MKFVRHLYDWVLAWAETPYGMLALAILSFAEACFFPVPPDVLLIALCLSIPARSYRFAFVATLFSVAGGSVGYWLGWGLWDVINPLLYQYVPGFTPDGFAQVKTLFDQYGFWTVFTAGFTPIPYKIFTITAGVFSINFPVFVLASLISRGLRFLMISMLLFYFGKSAREFIDRYFNILTIAFLVALGALLVIVKYLR